MPRDDTRHWTPERHRSGTYTAKDARAAENLIDGFDRATKPELAGAEHVQSLPAATTVQRLLTPFASSQLAPNASARRRVEATSKMADRLRLESERDAHRDWFVRDLKSEFERSSGKDRSHDTIKDMDLER
jgi:hypothetical protein